MLRTICGCTVPSVPASQPAAPTPQTIVQTPAPFSNGIMKHVIIRERAFDPDIVTISPGTTVVWTNEEAITHHVVHLPDITPRYGIVPFRTALKRRDIRLHIPDTGRI